MLDNFNVIVYEKVTNLRGCSWKVIFYAIVYEKVRKFDLGVGSLSSTKEQKNVVVAELAQNKSTKKY